MRTQRLRPGLVALGCAAVVVAAAGCGGPAAQQAEQQEEGGGGDGSLTVAAVSTSCLQYFPLYVGLEEGTFEEAGVDLQVERMNGSGAVLQAMLAGQVDIGTPGPIPLILSQAEGEDIRFIANLSPGGVFALVARDDSGTTEAADLAGATIGVATADGSEVSFTHTIMADAGLSQDDYEILVVGEGGQAVAGFERGDIDAYAASMDGVATLEHAGIGLTDLTGDATDYLYGNGLAADADFIAAKPELIGDFGRAYREAYEAGAADHEVIVSACEQHQPQEVEDPAYVEQHLAAVMPKMERTDGEPWGSMQEENWQQILDDAVASGDVEDGQLAAADLFTNEFVDRFNE